MPGPHPLYVPVPGPAFNDSWATSQPYEVASTSQYTYRETEAQGHEATQLRQSELFTLPLPHSGKIPWRGPWPLVCSAGCWHGRDLGQQGLPSF